MLESLNEIDWSTLKHAYGIAEDVPEQLRGLASGNTTLRENALNSLYGNVFHQGTRYEATIQTIPVLFELLESPKTPDRHEIICLLVNLAIGYPESHLPDGVDVDELQKRASAFHELNPQDRASMDKFGYGPHIDLACYEAVANGVPYLLKIVRESKSPRFLNAAIYGLAWFPESALTSIYVLLQRLKRPAAELTVAHVLLALGLLVRNDGSLERHQIETWLHHESKIIRLSAAIALAHQGIENDVLDVLLDAVQSRGELSKYEEAVLMNDGDLVGYASLVLSRYGATARKKIIPELCDTLKISGQIQSLAVTRSLLHLIESDEGNVRSKLESGKPVDAELIQALKAIGEYGGWDFEGAVFANYSELIRSFGLPGDRLEFTAMLDRIGAS